MMSLGRDGEIREGGLSGRHLHARVEPSLKLDALVQLSQVCTLNSTRSQRPQLDQRRDLNSKRFCFHLETIHLRVNSTQRASSLKPLPVQANIPTARNSRHGEQQQ